uniref:Protein kinase domain-containing protein n=1 Tax=Kalanchoe fedtschenkoi TaxID=63787 RepID=A0A7N0UFD4_KALFE
MRMPCCSSVIILTLLAAAAAAQSDIQALLDIKQGFLKDPSGKLLSSWDPKAVADDGCPQSWYGVTCNAGRVTSLAINDLGLVGDFSFTAAANLKLLSNLTLSNNRLTGSVSIPAPALGSLQVLDLSRNSFQGDIMLLLSHLGGPVQYVDLSSNLFTGSLDLTLGNSSTLASTITYLNVSGNRLTGELFPHDGMPYFDSLEVFDASNNQLAGVVPSFTFVVSLKVLRIGNNQLSGSLPAGLLQESSMVLSELDLSHNQLQGPVESITSSTLKYLNLSSNKLSGFLPLRVGRCAVVDLSNNEISGNISRMQGWGNYVEVVDLSSNLLRGSLPNETSQFLRLSSFRIANNSVTGVLPPVLGTYPELKVIDLSLNQLNGGLDMNLFALTKLVDLNLSGNELSGPLIPPAALDTRPAVNFSLVFLDLSSNSFNGSIPNGLNKFRNLIYLNFSRNQFTGGIPEDLPDNLERLDLSFNDLSGAIPENLRSFLDSSFHPGNPHLMPPYPHSSPENIPEIETRNKSHLKSVIRGAVVAGAAAVSVFTILFCAIILYRSRRRKYPSNNLNKDELSGADPQGNVQVSSPSLSQRKTDPSATSPKLPGSASSKPASETPTKAAITQISQSSGHSESVNKEEQMASPMSLLYSSDPSPKDQRGSENRGQLKASSPDMFLGDLHLFDSSLTFTAEELSLAPAEMVEKGCHGMLYRAVLASGHVLAVKWLREGIAKSKKEFAREAKKLGNIRHPNLVSLQGFCWGPNEHEKILISYFIDAPCLAHCLQEPERFPQLSVDHRLKIAADVACCLSYLHSERAIPHGNLKATNILLSPPNFTALLTDYSLHRIMTSAGTADQILNSAALGYIPPEFLSSHKPSPSLKSDVYAYGIILLELVTGKCSGDIASSGAGVVDLPLWVSTLAQENRIGDCFDRLLAQSAERDGRVLEGLLGVAMRCVLPASERPDMRTVVEDISALLI